MEDYDGQLKTLNRAVAKMNEKIDNLTNALTLQKEVLTLAEVSAYTGISKSRLYRLTSTRQIPFYKPKGRRAVFFKRTEIEEWLINH